MKTLPESGILKPAAICDLAKAMPKEWSIPITSPVDFISGPSRMSTLGKRLKGKTASLTEMCFGRMGFGETQLLQGFPQHHLRGELRQGNADRLADEGDGPRGAGVDLQDVELAVLDRVLDVHEADDVEFLGDQLRLALDRRPGVPGRR